MQKVNVNQLVHSASPFFMGVALQSWTVSGKPIDDRSHALGFVTSKPRQGLITADARISAAFDAGESLQVGLVIVRSDGSSVSLLGTTINQASGAGVIDMLEAGVLTDVRAGDVLHVTTTYTGGGSPVNPLIALLFQVG